MNKNEFETCVELENNMVKTPLSLYADEELQNELIRREFETRMKAQEIMTEINTKILELQKMGYMFYNQLVSESNFVFKLAFDDKIKHLINIQE